MDNLIQALILDNVKKRYDILMQMEETKNYHLVKDYAYITLEEDNTLKIRIRKNELSDYDKSNLSARLTLVKKSIKEYNENRQNINEMLSGMNLSQKLEALELDAKENEKIYKQFTSALTRIMITNNQLPNNYSGELPIADMERSKMNYSNTARVLKDSVEQSLNAYKIARDEEEKMF